MEKLIVITEEQQKILNNLFERLGINAQDLIDMKNSKEELDNLKKDNIVLEKRVTLLEESLKTVSDVLSDLITKKANEETRSMMDWSGDSDD